MNKWLKGNSVECPTCGGSRSIPDPDPRPRLMPIISEMRAVFVTGCPIPCPTCKGDGRLAKTPDQIINDCRHA